MKPVTIETKEGDMRIEMGDIVVENGKTYLKRTVVCNGELSETAILVDGEIAIKRIEFRLKTLSMQRAQAVRYLKNIDTEIERGIKWINRLKEADNE